MVTETLITAYPDFKFIGEETYKPGMKLTDAPTFIVDREFVMALFYCSLFNYCSIITAIDGTTNFVHGFPSVCISLGLAVNKSPTGMFLDYFMT